MKSSRTVTCALAASVALGGAVGLAPAAHASDAAGKYVPLTTPTRAFDSRSADSSLNGGKQSKLSTGESRTVPVVATLRTPTGGTVAPSQVSAVMVTTTAANGVRGGYVSTHRTAGENVSRLSTVNFPAGASVANTTIVPVAADGTIQVTEVAGSSDVVVDVVGWFTSSVAAPTSAQTSQVDITDPVRTYDSRYSSDGVMRNGETRTFTVKIPFAEYDINTVLMQLTVAQTSGTGYVKAWAGGTPEPNTSVLNFRTGQNLSSFVAVPVTKTSSGVFTFDVKMVGGSGHLILDSVGDTGPFGGGSLYRPVTVSRLFDTRSSGSVAAGATRTFTVPSGLRTANTWAITGNATMVPGSDRGYSLYWSGGQPRPNASTVNVMPGQALASGAATVLGGSGTTLSVFNGGGTSANMLYDISGTFEGLPGTLPAAKKRAWTVVRAR